MKQDDVQIYSISAIQSATTPLLSDIAEQSGGFHFIVDRAEALQEIASRVRLALGTVYRVGFRSRNSVNDGGWRQLTVQVERRTGISPAFTVRARSGYYADGR